MSSWKETVDAVDSEREYQCLLAPQQMENPLSIGEEIALLHKYLTQTLEAWSNDFTYPEIEALHGMRKIAGIAMRCMENHGAFKRTLVEMHRLEVQAKIEGTDEAVYKEFQKRLGSGG
jgi:hypothetical protein